MGTMIQTYGLREEDFRNEALSDLPGPLLGNNDLLCLTRPDVVTDIHRRYLSAGADLISTNSFNAQRISQADYGCKAFVKEINTAAVRLAREAAQEFSTPEKPRYVVASVGPTNKTLSISPDADDPAARSITFDQLSEAYTEQMVALLEAGTDIVMLETIFDTLNAKAGIFAFEEAMRLTGRRVPLMLSLTVDRQGRTLSGQTIEAFVASIEHAPLFSVGLNCSFGAAEMLPSLRVLASEVPHLRVSAHPNAGLPNVMGGYDQSPSEMAAEVAHFVEEGLVDIIGGCCGTTPQHIAALEPLTHRKPRQLTEPKPILTVSGLEVLRLTPEVGFVNVGERCNVAGSRKFLRLIREKAYDEALDVARRQVEDGAMVLDINMDDGLLDAATELPHFLRLMAAEPDICRVPVMLDSSKWDVLLEALKCVQGKCIVNSISLKEGEEVFIERARTIRRFGAAVVVMAFDEQGQADTLERRIDICRRSFELLTTRADFPSSDIIFDPNVLAIATGMPEHDAYALDFLRATEWIRQHMPDSHISGGVSNLSFAFRGNNYLREAMHAVFLYHARQRGLDFAILNPASKVSYADIPDRQLSIIEDAMLRPSAQHTERLTALASELMEAAAAPTSDPAQTTQQHEALSASERIIRALETGRSDTLADDLNEALEEGLRAVDVIEGPLMQGMGRVGQLFGEGKMFLPQVVKAARTMKQAVNLLTPALQQQQTSGKSAGTVMLATVKGDVHDIGKNIVGMVMACNGYHIIDLGVMVPAETIVEKALEMNPDVIGLSGLITPSLEEMVRTVRLLRQNGVEVPVMIGGATTSERHTALRIAPVYGGPVIWVKDASANAPLASQFLNPDTQADARRHLSLRQALLQQEDTEAPTISLSEARSRKPNFFDE